MLAEHIEELNSSWNIWNPPNSIVTRALDGEIDYGREKNYAQDEAIKNLGPNPDPKPRIIHHAGVDRCAFGEFLHEDRLAAAHTCMPPYGIMSCTLKTRHIRRRRPGRGPGPGRRARSGRRE